MRDRVVCGIRDAAGDLVGFTGRAAPQDTDAPKWLNTPATAIFSKGELLFGRTENRDRLAGGATPVRVEGVMDALAVTLASDGRAVGLAPLGTALTLAQACDRHDRPGTAHPARDRRRHRRPQKRPTATTGSSPPAASTSADSSSPTATRASTTPPTPTAPAPDSLAATLSATAVAPPLAGHLMADTIGRHRDHLREQNIYVIVATARELGKIIAASPQTSVTNSSTPAPRSSPTPPASTRPNTTRSSPTPPTRQPRRGPSHPSRPPTPPS